MTRLLRRLRDDERGSVLILVAGFLPVAVLLAAWVIELGNGAEHRRQLQLQADAGALAAAQEFVRVPRPSRPPRTRQICRHR